MRSVISRLRRCSSLLAFLLLFEEFPLFSIYRLHSICGTFFRKGVMVIAKYLAAYGPLDGDLEMLAGNLILTCAHTTAFPCRSCGR